MRICDLESTYLTCGRITVCPQVAHNLEHAQSSFILVGYSLHTLFLAYFCLGGQFLAKIYININTRYPHDAFGQNMRKSQRE